MIFDNKNSIKKVATLLFLLLASYCAGAQIYVDLDILTKNQNTSLEMVLRDSRTKEPIPYATVYIIPQAEYAIFRFRLVWSTSGQAEARFSYAT